VVRTALEDIPGIGPETAKKLLVRFGSLKGVQEAPLEALVAEVGERKAGILKKRLNAQ
jgi:excinuclease ABC subunit C